MVTMSLVAHLHWPDSGLGMTNVSQYPETQMQHYRDVPAGM